MALITNTDTTILPYNCDEMVYDIDRQMYVLTDLGVRRLTGYDLIYLSGSELQAELDRYEVSQDVYNFIARYTLFNYIDKKKWLIAKDGTLRELFKRVLADQMRYYIRSGAGLLKDMHGVDISKGKAMQIENIRGQNLISSSVEELLRQTPLMYTGKLYYYEYEKDGTW